MSRQLSLTEELEKLEQSITLTLQEIDSNFSRAHRIVTTSILPQVEQYGEHSKAVWEASKFWKQFFEASANVSLSGYEETAPPDEDTVMGGDEPSEAHDTTEDAQNQRTEADTTASYREDESMLDDGTGDLAGSTPRAQPSIKLRPQFAKLGSPYEDLRRELKGDSGDTQMSADDSDFDIVPHQHTTRLPNMSMTPRTSLGEAGLADDDVFSTARKTKDPLLHRVLDKNYRIQATPHKPTGVSPIKWKVTEKPQDKGKAPAWRDDSQMSSPDMTIPTLRSAAFMSPAKFPAGSRPKPPNMTGGPRTPGVSVQTPSVAKKTKDVYADTSKERGRQRDEITWESDEEDVYGGMSPPKTIQFALPPSKLLQTPAREASKRIVDDILITAGMEPEDSEDSPSVVKMNTDVMDDTF